MRKSFQFPILATLLLAVNGCGGGGDNAFETPEDPGTTGPEVSSVSVLASSPQLLSDNSAPVAITVRVLNASNQAISDVPVSIQVDSGILTDVEQVTGESGTATANLINSEDLSNRVITVTATAGDVSDTVTVNVTGTHISPNPLPAITIVQGATVGSTITLLDAGNRPIASQQVTVNSASGNDLSATTITTDTDGQASVTVTGSVAGTDTLTFSVLGLDANQSITVSNDSFAFTAPAAAAEIELDDSATPGIIENNTLVSVTWTLGGVAQVGEPIEFATTRGTLYEANGTTCTTTELNGPVTTIAGGIARACLAATNAGPAVISATTDTDAIAERAVEFVATEASTINVQAEPTTITTEATSVITAVVRDASNNRVKNKTVVFTLNDTTGGTLSKGSVLTDSQGLAQTVYRSSTSTSAANGVVIDARVQGTLVTDSTALTVARRALRIVLGTGNEIDDDVAVYRIPYSIIVTDANGAGVANTELTVRLATLWYRTGARAFLNDQWTIDPVLDNDVCIDEDASLPDTPAYRNGILDPDEDTNDTGILEAGNIATVTPATVTTGSDGTADIEVVYPQEYAYWAKVELSATATVQGTESTYSVAFVLPGSEEDFQDEDSNPPGFTSPFGIVDYQCPDPATFP